MSATSFDLPSTAREGFGGRENQVFPKFYRGEKPDPIASRDAGVPINKSVDMVMIFQAGEKDYQREEVNDLHKQRWPNQWASYQQGVEQMQSGTPLAILFPANPEVISELARVNVFSVQALANVPDSSGAVIPYLTTWKKKAAEFLKNAESGKGFHEAEKRAEAAELKAMELEDTIAKLEARLKAVESDKPKAKE